MKCLKPSCKGTAIFFPTLRGEKLPNIGLCVVHHHQYITFAEFEALFVEMKLLLDREITKWEKVSANINDLVK